MIGSGNGHTFQLADLDHDRKIDIVTQDSIFFQIRPTTGPPSPARITTGPSSPAASRTCSGPETLTFLASPISRIPPRLVREPTRSQRKSSDSDNWIPHVIGPGYVTTGDSVAFAAADFNGTGHVDVVTAQSERETTTTRLPADSFSGNRRPSPDAGVDPRHARRELQ